MVRTSRPEVSSGVQWSGLDETKHARGRADFLFGGPKLRHSFRLNKGSFRRKLTWQTECGDRTPAETVQLTGHAQASEGRLRSHAWATESVHGIVTGLKKCVRNQGVTEATTVASGQ